MGEPDKPAWLVAGSSDEKPGRRSLDRRAVPITAMLAGLAVLGLICLLNEIAPGAAGAPRFYDRGVRYYKEYKYAEAKEAFSRAIALDSTFYRAYFGRAVVYQHGGETDAAIADYAAVIRLKPDQSDAFFNRGLVYDSLGDTDRALADFDAVVRLRPSDPDGYLRRIAIYRRLGDFNRALTDRDALVRLDDKYLPYYADRAALRREAGDLDGAIADIDTALQISSEYADAYRQRALLRRQKDDTDGAVADLAQAIRLEPDDLRPYLARGEILRDTGRTDAAKAEFDSAISRNAKDATGYLQRGALELFWLGDAAAAASDLDTAFRTGVEYHGYRRLFANEIRIPKLNIDIAPLNEPPAIAPDVPYVPAIYQAVVWRHIARVRASQDDAAELADAKSRLGKDVWGSLDILAPLRRDDWRQRIAWPGQIAMLFVGEVTPEIVRRTAEAAPGGYERGQRICEADFYIAEFHLLNGATDEARTLLRSAAAGCPAWGAAAGFAKSELKRLGSWPAACHRCEQ
jgi:tetratricopeptide (TPR) repeat protein